MGRKCTAFRRKSEGRNFRFNPQRHVNKTDQRFSFPLSFVDYSPNMAGAAAGISTDTRQLTCLDSSCHMSWFKFQIWAWSYTEAAGWPL